MRSLVMQLSAIGLGFTGAIFILLWLGIPLQALTTPAGLVVVISTPLIMCLLLIKD